MGDVQTPWSQLPYYMGVTGHTGANGYTDHTLVPSVSTTDLMGSKGEMRLSNEYLYVCIDTTDWKRVQLSYWT
jgi:hypothetical protein